jgi:SAM-dependent methyltransferase
MSETIWFEDFFGVDYFAIYEDVLPPERTAAEVKNILALLDLPPGARVLDMACGHGRHAIPLALLGYQVTGFDLSEVFLERARADAEAAGASVRWLHGDMRELPFDGEFDAVINIFTAFGYFEDPADDLRVLRGVRSALRPGGRFLLETLHRDGLVARFAPRSFEKTTSGAIVLHERRWDLVGDVIVDEVTLIRPDGTRRNFTTRVRLHSLDEFLALLRQADLEPEGWYGGLDAGELGLNSRRLAIISRRPS